MENWELVSEKEFLNLNGSLLSEDDILMTLTGDPPDVGKVIIINDSSIPATFNQRVARVYLNPEQKEFISSKAFFAIISSKYCREQLERYAKGIRQRNLGIECIQKLIVPIPSKLFQEKLNDLVQTFGLQISQSNKIYRDVELFLLKDLGVLNWQPTEKNTAIKKISNFLSNGRLDAEYYQPKYDELLAKLNKVKHLPLHQLVNCKKSIEPGSEAYETEGIPFIRVSDISKFGISQPEHHISRGEFDIEDLKPKKNTILLTKDGSVGIAYKVDKDLDVITSGALLHLTLKSDEVLPDYLTLILNSKLTQMQAERDAGGSIIQHWRPDEIKQVVIPILPMDRQKELVKQIKNSFKLREESSQLIEKAKQAVEIAIEKDEKTAMKFLNRSI